ncbi:phosphatase PAP2 family protein [Gordonia sp. LSe1-13]|uniref:Phosphatase PAP2 family protein n=1 Tax=Gordonia sesuvii TaxID=3116777 RepID=A0ABU7MH07_9ACTN|nr:phosphatase PAP2 family protein [Gordonia sp. LSe1-13]
MCFREHHGEDRVLHNPAEYTAPTSPPDEAQPQRNPHTIIRWLVICVVAAAVGVAGYVLAVRTVTGQRIENAALRGADQAGRAMTAPADSVLGTITITSMVIAMLALLVVAVLRRQPWVGLAALVIIVGGQAIVQVLKSYVLPRPELIDASPQYVQNSLPSGHTAAAMTILLAVLLVTPFRLRGLTVLVVLPWVIGVGAYTITAKWHRFSDTLTADAIALVVACVVCVVGVRTKYLTITEAGPPSHIIGRRVIVWFWVVLFVIATGIGLALWALTWRNGQMDDAAEYNYFLGAQLLSAAGAIASGLVFWWTLQRVSIGDGPAARDDSSVG